LNEIFWNFLKDENIAEEILYDLYIKNKIKFEQNSSVYIIIWIMSENSF
jgi:hypothetical protein